MESWITCGFVAVMSVLGSLLVGNDLALFLQVKMGLPFWAGFIGFLVLVSAGGGVAYHFGKLFWYAGIIALIGASFAITALGLPRR